MPHKQKRPSALAVIRARLAQGPALLSITLGFGQFLGLLRTTGVARYLGTEIQAEAVIIGLITGFFGSIFTLNAAWQLVQSPRYDLPDFVSSLHASALLRGIAATLLIAGASTGFLLLLDRPNLIFPMILASTVPALDGLINLDAWRLIREGQYRRLAAVELAGPVCSVAGAIGILMFTRSIWAIPVIAVSASLGKAVVSQLIATRRWWPRLYRNDVREILAFTLPLIPAGVLFWLNTQSDRLVILLGERLSWMETFDTSELGAYGTVAMIVVLPAGTIVKTLQSVVVPGISSARDSREDLQRAFHKYWRAVLGLSAVISALGTLVGVPVLGLLLGTDFSAGLDIAGILIGALSIQLMRHLCYASSTGLGTTTAILFGNCLRLSGLVFAIASAVLLLGLAGLAWSVLAAEVIATIGAGFWLRKRLPGVLPRVVVAAILLAGIAALMRQIT